LLAESQILEDEILSGAEDAHPANEVPEQQDHGPRSYRNTWLHALWKSFISRVQEVFDEAQEFLRSTVDVMLGNSLLTVQSPSDWQLSVVLIVQVRWLAFVDPDTAQLRYDCYGWMQLVLERTTLF
jgi:hypothetical protein